MKTRILQLLVVSSLILAACNNKYKGLEDGIYADMETDRGTVLLKLYQEDTPVTVANFVSLAEGTNPLVVDSLKGKKFYDGLGFHRVIKDFMVQGGDPRGDGLGGPGYRFFDEFPKDSLNKLKYKHDAAGVVSMANSGRGTNTNGSQFFITHKPTPWLDNVHTIFGEVVNGQETIDSISQYDMIKSIKIVRIGDKAKKFDAPKVFSEGTDKFFADQKAKKEKEEADRKAFLAQIKKEKESVKPTESGLRILKIKKGDGKGKKVTKTDPIQIHYTLRLQESGRLIQSTEGKSPFSFVMNRQPMIPGFTEAVLNMREGDKSRLFIPYYLAYGERGGGPFPPKADIVFDVEILKVGQ